MRKIFLISILLLASRFANADVILQYFETRWDEIDERLPEIAETGYDALWTPPPGKSPIGGNHPFAYGGNVGYNSFDRFDLGDMPQRGSRETRYGSRSSLRNLADDLHRCGMKIYPDIVFNHAGNGPDFRTYPGMVPQDFHVWEDAGQPGGFRRAPRMDEWVPDGGRGATFSHELVSLMDIQLEFDNRFQAGGWASRGYVSDPPEFVRHAGDPDKYPYFSRDGMPAENSREFIVRWINWLGYAMDYDGVRLDAPKHVVKEFFGLPADPDWTRSFLYNIQKNFNERRGLNDPNSADELYQNDIRRDDALVFSEFFIGSVGEVDYWRNPSDRSRGIQARFLDFPRKSQMMAEAFSNGNLGALDRCAGFSPEEGVMFAHSHDESPPNKLELAYAYILTRAGTPIVYFSGNNLKAAEIGREQGKNTWMNKGCDDALGDLVNGCRTNAITNLVGIHNQFCRGSEQSRWSDNDCFAFERYQDTNANGLPDPGEGLVLVALNDSGSDLERQGIQTAFAPGTKLRDHAGKNLETVTVGSDGKANIRVPGNGGQGWVCYAPFTAGEPASGAPIEFAGDAVGTMNWVVPGGRDAPAKPRTITRLSGNSAAININYSEPAEGGERVDNVLVKWGQGRDLNAGATDFTDKSTVTGGFEQATKTADGHYRIVADLTNIPEGLHVVRARVFNGRTDGKPALFQTFSTAVYVDRHGPDLTFENLAENETLEGARVVTVNNPDRTLHSLAYRVDGGAPQAADMVIRGKWRICLDGLPAGAHSITLEAAEADHGSPRKLLNSSSLTRGFFVDTSGPPIAINHAPGATITEPFFKTVVTVPAGQGITASDVRLYWNSYEQLPLTENPAGSGRFESVFDGRYIQGGAEKLFTGAFVNGANFFEAVVTKNGENHSARKVSFNLFGRTMHDSDGDGIPDEIEMPGFLEGTNPGPDQKWPGDTSCDLIPNYGESWSRLNPMSGDTDYNGVPDGDEDSDGDGVSNIQEVIQGCRLAGDPCRYGIYDASSVPPALHRP